MSDEQNDYSEIFTPTDPRDGWPEAEQMNSAMSGISGRAIIFMFKVTFSFYIQYLGLPHSSSWRSSHIKGMVLLSFVELANVVMFFMTVYHYM
jgi:hypothetical protein